MAAYTDKKKASNQKWDAENIDRMSIALKKGMRDKIKAAAAAAGCSANKYIETSVMEKMERDGVTDAEPQTAAE